MAEKIEQVKARVDLFRIAKQMKREDKMLLEESILRIRNRK